MEITLNGEKITLDKSYTISDLLTKYQLEVKKVAVEKNLEIVSKSSYSDTMIDAGDNIEIIHFIGGG